ncbi:MAG TPA: hypothetical protein VMW91_12265 [Desulfosporosinus sp.]|nr:hypothetical protein [Desulfosporosinus sp.]
MNANELHVHQSSKKRVFVVGLMVLFAISFHSLAWLRLGLVTTHAVPPPGDLSQRKFLCLESTEREIASMSAVDKA